MTVRSNGPESPNQRIWAAVALVAIFAGCGVGLLLAGRNDAAFLSVLVGLIGPTMLTLVTAEKVQKLHTELHNSLGDEIAQKAADVTVESLDHSPPTTP